MKFPAGFTLAILLAFASGSAFAAGKASFGFGTRVETSGFFLNPNLERVEVARVAPDSPADNAGLRVGDVLVSANDRRLAGAPAKDMATLMRSFEPGDQLRLRVQRDGAEIEVVITAASR